MDVKIVHESIKSTPLSNSSIQEEIYSYFPLPIFKKKHTSVFTVFQ